MPASGGALAVVREAVRVQLGGEVEDRRDHRVRSALTARGAAGAVEQPAVVADEGGLHPGTAHVEGDDMSHHGP